MPSLRYTLRLKLWLYPGKAAWTFATLPKREGREIRDLLGAAARGWGSLPVRATLGATTWDTSIFPDAKTDSYLLPVKAAVRRAEGVASGDTVDIELVVTDPQG